MKPGKNALVKKNHAGSEFLPIKYEVKSKIIFSWSELGNIHILRQHTFGTFLTQTPTMSP